MRPIIKFIDRLSDSYLFSYIITAIVMLPFFLINAGFLGIFADMFFSIFIGALISIIATSISVLLP